MDSLEAEEDNTRKDASGSCFDHRRVYVNISYSQTQQECRPLGEEQAQFMAERRRKLCKVGEKNTIIVDLLGMLVDFYKYMNTNVTVFFRQHDVIPEH
ncbi:hypothetical protein TorRG33x02_004420 [Trema orientale]|uniref:Uncharacterized protein n=1 Tax=Trema orientale TaxID=63057 RepID=A0A2P5G247_TREOI|nr:hypothetical protein TorRG33x02_004420 [Trema orientale]